MNQTINQPGKKCGKFAFYSIPVDYTHHASSLQVTSLQKLGMFHLNPKQTFPTGKKKKTKRLPEQVRLSPFSVRFMPQLQTAVPGPVGRHRSLHTLLAPEHG